MTLLSSTLLRLVVTALALIALVGQLAHLDALTWHALGIVGSITREVRPSFLTLVAADAVVSVCSGVLAVTLAFRGRSEDGSRGLGLALAAWSYLLAYSGIVVLLRPDPGLMRVVFEGHFPLVELVGLAGLAQFAGRFPRRLTADDLTDPATLPVGIRTAQQIRIWMLRPSAPWVTAVVALAFITGVQRITGRPLADAGLNPAMDIIRFSAVLLVVLNARRSWLASPVATRAPMVWVLVGLGLLCGMLALIIGGNILLSAAKWGEPAVAWRPILLDMGLLGLLWGFGMGVFYRGSWSAESALRRVVSHALYAGLGLSLATGLEVLFSEALVSRVAFPPGSGTVVALMVLVAGYRPAISFIDRLIDMVPPLEGEGLAQS